MRWSAILFLVGVLSFLGRGIVYADPGAVTRCSGTGTPPYRDAGQRMVEMFFAIRNESTSDEQPSAAIKSVKIEPPAGTAIRGAGADVSGGNFNLSGGTVEFFIPEEAYPTGNTETFRVVIDVGSEPAYANGFTVRAISYPEETQTYVTCPISIDMPPTISDLAFVVQSESTALITWNTNEAATSIVRFGSSSQVYDRVGGDENQTTNHSVSLGGLIAGSTQYLMVESTDGTGNTTQSQEFTLAMPTPGSAVTEVVTTVTVTNTVTHTTTNTNTNTVVRMIVDSTPPKVTLTNTWEQFYAKGPTVTGTAADNKLVVAVDYSIDKGKTWRPVEIDNRKARVAFEIDLPIEEEGNYDFQVRAYDAEGNKGISKTQTIVIDRLPPLFGATYLSWGSGLAVPTTQEFITTMVGIPLTLTLGAVGGPIGVTIGGLEAPYTLFRDDLSGRWTGRLAFSLPGDRTITATGVDGFGRTTTSSLFSVNVLPAGTVVNAENGAVSAEVFVMAQDPITGVFSLWDGMPFGWENPIKTTDGGEFGLVLPQGTYYLRVQSMGYRQRISNMFTLDGTGLVRAHVVLSPQQSFAIGAWKLPLPGLWQRPFTAELALSSDSSIQGTATRKLLWNQPLPQMEFISETGDVVNPTDWLGQPTVFLLDSPWLPSIAQSIGSLNQLATDFPKLQTVWLASQQGASVLQGIRARTGNTVLTILADDKATLSEYLGIHQLPVSVVLDRMGIVRGIYRGIAPNEMILRLLEE